MIGWDLAAITFVTWTWLSLWHQDAARTRVIATRDDPSRAVMDVILLGAALASLAAVGFALVGASQEKGAAELVRIVLGLASVALSWAVVHTVFCLKYASLHYSDGGSGIRFPTQDDKAGEAPDYVDFAYVAFTIGMTYQVSDTELTTRPLRRTALQHALISFLFGTVILATAINLVAGLSK
jgi:uncharacterized membrane protein